MHFQKTIFLMQAKTKTPHEEILEKWNLYLKDLLIDPLTESKPFYKERIEIR